MRNNAILVVLLFFCLAKVQGQVQLTRVYGGESYDFGAEVIPTSDGGYLIAGSSSSFENDVSSQVLVFKADEWGNVVWRKNLGGVFADLAESMVETADGNLLVAGFSETINATYQFYALKLTMDGDTIWTRHYGGAAWDFCRQVAALPDGGFALLGQTYSYGAGEGDFYLIRIDSEGDTLWTKTYGGALDESGESIALAADGGFFLAGTTESFGAGGKDMYVVRVDSNGDTLWTKAFGGVEDDICNAVAAAADGGYILAGGTYNFTPGKSDFILRKEDGIQQWVKTESKPGDNFLTDVIVEPGTQNVTTVGYLTESDEFGGVDGRILRYGADGIWNGVAKNHGTSETDNFIDIKLTSDGGYAILGTTQGYLNRFDDVWLVKTNNQGFGVSANVAINEINIGNEAFAVRVAPNPVGSYSQLMIDGYELISKAFNYQVELRVFNALGKLVHVQNINSGNEMLQLNDVAAGILSYQLVAGNELLATGKLVKLNQ
ncbi:MAG: hypothetical protein RL266_155 [Bacteroidota bacterium]|jgi:hypothetical protein